jgi:hypothetical protein
MALMELALLAGLGYALWTKGATGTDALHPSQVPPIAAPGAAPPGYATDPGGLTYEQALALNTPTMVLTSQGHVVPPGSPGSVAPGGYVRDVWTESGAAIMAQLQRMPPDLAAFLAPYAPGPLPPPRSDLGAYRYGMLSLHPDGSPTDLHDPMQIYSAIVAGGWRPFGAGAGLTDPVAIANAYGAGWPPGYTLWANPCAVQRQVASQLGYPDPGCVDTPPVPGIPGMESWAPAHPEVGIA